MWGLWWTTVPHGRWVGTMVDHCYIWHMGGGYGGPLSQGVCVGTMVDHFFSLGYGGPLPKLSSLDQDL